MIQLQRLEGFYWVARTEGYARAARAFPYPITQSGVHQQVHRLEADLGCALFLRAGKDRVQLTSAGRALYQAVAPFIEGLKGIEAAISTRAFGGTLRVQTASLHLKGLLPDWARRLAKARPDILLEVKEARRAAPDDLLSGACDLILDHLPAPPRGVRTREVGQLFSFLALPTAHRLGRQKTVKLEQLRNEAFVVYNEDISARELQLAALRQAGVTPMKLLGADSAEAILGFVAAGLGAALVPWPDVRGPKIAGVAVHRLKMEGAVFPVHAAWRTSLPADPLVEAALAQFA